MNEYILDPRDTLRILPPADGEPAMLELICERTMIFFDLPALEQAGWMDNVPAVNGPCRALCLTVADALLGAKHQIFIPENQSGFASFFASFAPHAPQFTELGSYVKVTCDQTGSHHLHK